MKIAVITGSGGLVGSEASRFFASKGFKIVGVDNDMRSYFFGAEASTSQASKVLTDTLPNYEHFNSDIRNRDEVNRVFSTFGSDIEIVVHTAAQPSHDWAAKEPVTDFEVNAQGTLYLLEAVRKFCPKAVFIFTSTNKVYGDRPNQIPVVEQEMRWEVPSGGSFEAGIDETMPIDQSTHSLFGASKLAADVMVQEYGRYFGLATGVFRGGCLTGPNHAGTQMHGFLSYLVKCLMRGESYTVFGHLGKQVRDNIHSFDLVGMFWAFYQNPRIGEVYNVGGGRHSNCSMLEAIEIAEQLSQRKLRWSYAAAERKGDHRWYISDVEKFRGHYPEWDYSYSLRGIVDEIIEFNAKN